MTPTDHHAASRQPADFVGKRAFPPGCADRRLGFRVPLELMMTSYVRDRPLRVLTADVSDTGLRLHAVSPRTPGPGTLVGLELELPGTGDTIWASAEVCYAVPDMLASGLGVRFVAMARSHARLVRDFCVEHRRAHLGALLGRIRGAA
jgi:hypothetical protein